MRFVRAALVLMAGLASPATSQVPLATYADAFESRFDPARPAVQYTVRVDTKRSTSYAVEMRIRGARDTLRFAMPIWAPGAYRVVTFSRYVRDLGVESGGRSLSVVQEDSSSWRAVIAGGEATVRYRIVYPSDTAARAPTNRSFLRETGALLDGPATYMYVVGEKLVPAHVRFEVPADWRIATGLVPTTDPRVFYAPSYDVLIDSPVLMGALRTWRFDVDGVPHRVAYWPQPSAVPFDTATFVSSLERIVRAGGTIMGGRLPYRDYTFLYVDGAGGGLEHLNSTTIGAPSAALARDPLSRTSVSAHEFFHLWNVKRLRPAVLGPFDYQQRVRTTELWWSEGVTDYFANEIERRAGLMDEAAAKAGLAESIASYLENPAHDRISPERSSWTAWDPSAVNGGYSISYYLQGLLIGELLEMRLRDETAGARGMDDLVRLLFSRFAGTRGFSGDDVLRAANEVCGCDLQPFFAQHVSGAVPLDFDRHLALAGWKLVMERAPATDRAGARVADLQLGVVSFGGIGSAGGVMGSRPKLSVPDPLGAWARAGVASGDEIVTLNGRPVASADDFRAATAGVRVGDVVRLEYLHAGVRRSASVTVPAAQRLRVTLADLPTLTERQLAVRRKWLGQ